MAALTVLASGCMLAAIAAVIFADDLVELFLALGNGLFAVQAALERQWAGCAISGAVALLCALLWRRNRRKGKKAPRAYGAKSRALIAAMVARLRETARPRRVLKPVPGGAV